MGGRNRHQVAARALGEGAAIRAQLGGPRGAGQIDRGAVDTVVTLCAEELCPVYLGSARRRHWPLSDPAGHDESEEASLRRFRAVRDELRERIRRFLIEEGVLRDGEEAK